MGAAKHQNENKILGRHAIAVQAVIDSTLVARQFASDPDLRLPHRPRFPPELVTVPFGHDGVLIAGVAHTQVIRGGAARQLLPRLLRELDGRRTVDEIAALVHPCPPALIRNAVALLYSRGLVEDGLPATTPDSLANLSAFAGRVGDVTRANRNRGECCDRLRTARLVIEGSPDAVAILRAQLDESGVGTIVAGDEGLRCQPGTSVVVAVATSQAVDLGAILKAAKTQNCLALHVRLGEEAIQVGPLFIPGRPMCYECMRRLHAGPTGDADAASREFWLSFVALHLCQLLGRLSTATLHNGFNLYQLTPDGIVQSHHHVVGVPGCPTCALGEPALDPQSDEFTTWLLHSSVAMPSHHLINPREHQNHYTAANIALTSEESERYYGAPVLTLPDADALTRVSPWVRKHPGDDRLHLRELATLLWYAAGYRRLESGSRWRIAPTGGGLGSPELFVIAREVEGLSSGIYHYHSPSHVLERLADSSSRVIEAALGAHEELPGCVFVGAGALGRVRSKYQNFAYRLINLDAGIALSYLMEVAASYGAATRYYPAMHDEALAELVSLPTNHDLHVATCALGLSAIPTLQGHLRQRPTTPAVLLRRVIGAVSRPPGQSRRNAASPGCTDEESPTRGVQEPPLSLGEVLMRRRSVRRYERRPISRDTLAFIARRGAGMHRELIELAGPSVGVRIWLALHTADELSTGLYEVLTLDGSLRLHRQHVSVGDVMACLLQKSLAQAPAFVFVTGDIGTALSDRGPRGYRELHLFAGAIISRMWLAATSHGVGACATAGLVDDGLVLMTGRNAYREAPLFGLTLGYPAGVVP